MLYVRDLGPRMPDLNILALTVQEERMVVITDNDLVTSQRCREHQGSGSYDAAINEDNVTGYP